MLQKLVTLLWETMLGVQSESSLGLRATDRIGKSDCIESNATFVLLFSLVLLAIKYYIELSVPPVSSLCTKLTAA